MATPKKNIQISEDGRLTHDITTTNTAACHEALTATIGAPELLPEVLVRLLTTPPAMEDGDNILQLEMDPPEEAEAWAWVICFQVFIAKEGFWQNVRLVKNEFCCVF